MTLLGKVTTTSFALSALVAGFVGFAPAPVLAGDDVDVLSCRARAAGGLKIVARHEHRSRDGETRRKRFKTSFEALPSNKFRVGTMVTVVLEGRTLGSRPLASRGVSPKLKAELKLDTKNSPGDVSLPYPANLNVARGNEVVVKVNGAEVLSCTL
jgi:hypothetical protein